MKAKLAPWMIGIHILFTLQILVSSYSYAQTTVYENFVVCTSERTTGQKQYELKDHLSNVRAVVSDRKVAEVQGPTIAAFHTEVTSWNDAFAFGATMPGRAFSGSTYRYGFNGMEQDDEVKAQGNSYDFGARFHDPRVGRFLSLDPKADAFTALSPYAYAANSPVSCIDENGEGPIFVIASLTETESFLEGLQYFGAPYYIDRNYGRFELFRILAYGSINEYVNNDLVIDKSNYARRKIAESEDGSYIEVPPNSSIVFSGMDANTPANVATFIGFVEGDDGKWEQIPIASVKDPIYTGITVAEYDIIGVYGRFRQQILNQQKPLEEEIKKLHHYIDISEQQSELDARLSKSNLFSHGNEDAFFELSQSLRRDYWDYRIIKLEGQIKNIHKTVTYFDQFLEPSVFPSTEDSDIPPPHPSIPIDIDKN